ncbi:glycoside hydrolase family 5 protein [Puia dinghuensis]|uniref:Endoglucanase n=1 Tax=Puia dinghuensis TaxID=1792502 RepID=A0A8J2UDF4_9BACT|nr:cellulase family glycosylhydrolase [Puia dinghuensis]GGB02296.1 endoglucanase [Puia dinghuensis]
MRRRNFIKNAGLLAGGLTLLDQAVLPSSPRKTNPLPKWRGFNVLDFFSPNPAPSPHPTTEEHIRWMRDWGFDFVRIPMAYPHYLQFDRSRDITPDEVFQMDEQKVEEVDRLVMLINKYGMHANLNLHRAPGYCINAGFHEPYNLWKDQAALDAFCFHWNFWARRFRNISKDKLSFDLLNEPAMRMDMNDQHSPGTAVPGDIYRKVAGAATEAIRKETPERLIIADGNWGGSNVVPELIDLNIAQSCRGYNPHAISHYKAPWANKDPDHNPEPKWPGQVGNQYLSRDMLETYYKPWIKLAGQGVGVHCGECGCWNKTPHDVFLAWFTDVLDILSSNGIGFALWNFIGDFGILDSGRSDVAYEDWHGHKLDRQLLELLQKH